MQYPCGWVSPFGHCRIKACCQLPDTFRRLPRPSSPLTAKASTVCAWSLDPIAFTLTDEHNRTTTVATIAYLPQRHVFLQVGDPAEPRHSCRSPTRIAPFRRLLHPPCQRTLPDLNAWQNLVLSCAPSRKTDTRHRPAGGSGRTRTSDLTLIRGAL